MSKIKITFSTFLIFCVVHAQKIDSLSFQPYSNVNFFYYNPNDNLSIANVLQSFYEKYNLNKDFEYKQFREDVIENIIKIEKFELYYKGFKIENSNLFIFKNYSFQCYLAIENSVKKNYFCPNTLIDSNQAIISAYHFLNQNTNSNFLKVHQEKKSKIEKTSIVFTSNNSSEYELCYRILTSKVNLNTENDASDLNQLIYVSASDGKVFKIASLTEANSNSLQKNNFNSYNYFTLPNCSGHCTSGNGNTNHYGNRSINLYEGPNGIGCNDRLIDYCGNTKFKTVKPSSANISVFQDIVNSNQIFGSSELNGVTAHWCGEMAVNYFKSNHNHDGMSGNASINTPFYFTIKSSHPDPLTNNGTSDNSAYDPTSDDINCGAGFSIPHQFATLDILGHEYTHGIRRYATNNISGSFGEAGAVEESFADIFGAMTEFYTKNSISGIGTPNYLMDEEIIPGGIRDMSNPNSKSHPDYYGGAYWANTNTNFDNGNKHSNNGVGNFWFYLLAEGGSQSVQTIYVDNNTYFIRPGYCIKGIGRVKAAQIAYLNLISLPANSNYAAARSGAISAATTLFGAGSEEEAQCTQAWNAVGVGNIFLGPYNFQNQIISNTSYLSYNAPVNLINMQFTFPSDYTVTSYNEVQFSPNFDAIQNSNFNAYIAPAICDGSVNNSAARLLNENSNTKLSNVLTDENNLNLGKDLDHLFYNDLTINPNPSDGVFKLELTRPNNNSFSINLFNSLGETVIKINSLTTNIFYLNICDQPEGIYLLKIIDNESVYFKKIIKN